MDPGVLDEALGVQLLVVGDLLERVVEVAVLVVDLGAAEALLHTVGHPGPHGGPGLLALLLLVAVFVRVGAVPGLVVQGRSLALHRGSNLL